MTRRRVRCARRVSRCGPSRTLSTLNAGSLTGTRGVILNNVPAYKLPSDFLAALDLYVRCAGRRAADGGRQAILRLRRVRTFGGGRPAAGVDGTAHGTAQAGGGDGHRHGSLRQHGRRRFAGCRQRSTSPTREPPAPSTCSGPQDAVSVLGGRHRTARRRPPDPPGGRPQGTDRHRAPDHQRRRRHLHPCRAGGRMGRIAKGAGRAAAPAAVRGRGRFRGTGRLPDPRGRDGGQGRDDQRDRPGQRSRQGRGFAQGHRRARQGAHFLQRRRGHAAGFVRAGNRGVGALRFFDGVGDSR